MKDRYITVEGPNCTDIDHVWGFRLLMQCLESETMTNSCYYYYNL